MQIVSISNLTRLNSILVAMLYAVVGGSVYFTLTYKLGLFNRIIGFKLRRHRKNETKS